jgi:hypothetical protein
MDEGLQDHCALVLTDTINFEENNLEISKIIPIFAAMLLTNIPKIMTTECINPQLPVPTTALSTKNNKKSPLIMKKLFSVMRLTIGLLVISFIFIACSGDSDEPTTIWTLIGWVCTIILFAVCIMSRK